MKIEDLSRTQRLLAIGFVWLVILIILFLIAEGAVRVRAYLKTGMAWGVEGTFVEDPASGLRIPRPGLDTGAITINSKGFRGPEIDEAKPPGTIRIAFLGGSTTYCAEVSSNEWVWPHLVAEAIQERFPDTRIEYLNGGVPGYGVEHSLRNLNSRIKPYDPDVIVIYHATNDLSFNSFQLAVDAGVATERADKDKFWLSNYSLLSHLVELNLKILLLKDSEPGAVGKLDVDRERIAAPFRDDMTEIVRAAADIAPVVAVATFATQYREEQPAEQQLEAASTSLYYMPYLTIDGLLTSFDAYHDVIREVAESEGVLLVGDEDAIPGDPTHFKDSVHLTDEGSAKMADRVSRALLESDRFLELSQPTTP